MAIFFYRAYSNAGDLREGQVEAASREAAEETVWRQGLTPFEWRDGAAPARSGFSLFSAAARPSATRLAAFTREFATLEQADVPLDQSLRLGARDAPEVDQCREEPLKPRRGDDLEDPRRLIASVPERVPLAAWLEDQVARSAQEHLVAQ